MFKIITFIMLIFHSLNIMTFQEDGISCNHG
ncbi:uncharacterized protein METZ01_LOCUS276373 [marine metagenome]|uniref:Uncharacterized protein n=1 Tax=marine metagenome TaxID=408172 RepID=A0A382KH36_9ZZZZ